MAESPGNPGDCRPEDLHRDVLRDEKTGPAKRLTHRRKRRTWGFRFSIGDAMTLTVGVAFTAGFWPILGWSSTLFLFVIGHFFLFCNVFRLRRKPELIWTVVFFGNSMLWYLLPDFGIHDMALVYILQLPVTAWLIAREIHHPSYHGIFADRWNAKHLQEYLDGAYWK